MLTEYTKKRHFKNTPEPNANRVDEKKNQLIFVVQKHQASHLHYDFRMEMEGVLKSWVVPKVPSMNPKIKRLAIMVEDHPVEYATFQGFIPEGNYGAGTVEIWDKGIYKPVFKDKEKSLVENLRIALKIGQLDFELKGKKMKGSFSLIKLKGQKENLWLLFKNGKD